MNTSLHFNNQLSRQTSSSGFTLIELLTVIAIIGILAAIIIPVTSKVRDTARKTKCLSATRQIGIGFLAYAGDHKDMFPVQTTSPLSNEDPNSWVAQISVYTAGVSVFACAEYKPKLGDPLPTAHRLYNGFASRRMIQENTAPTRMAQSLAPGQDVLMVEQNTSSNLATSEMMDWPNGSSFWHYPHSGQGNPVDASRPNNVTRCVLYVDGHVNRRSADIQNINWLWPSGN